MQSRGLAAENCDHVTFENAETAPSNKASQKGEKIWLGGGGGFIGPGDWGSGLWAGLGNNPAKKRADILSYQQELAQQVKDKEMRRQDELRRVKHEQAIEKEEEIRRMEGEAGPHANMKNNSNRRMQEQRSELQGDVPTVDGMRGARRSNMGGKGGVRNTPTANVTRDTDPTSPRNNESHRTCTTDFVKTSTEQDPEASSPKVAADFWREASSPWAAATSTDAVPTFVPTTALPQASAAKPRDRGNNSQASPVAASSGGNHQVGQPSEDRPGTTPQDIVSTSDEPLLHLNNANSMLFAVRALDAEVEKFRVEFRHQHKAMSQATHALHTEISRLQEDKEGALKQQVESLQKQLQQSEHEKFMLSLLRQQKLPYPHGTNGPPTLGVEPASHLVGSHDEQAKTREWSTMNDGRDGSTVHGVPIYETTTKVFPQRNLKHIIRKGRMGPSFSQSSMDSDSSSLTDSSQMQSESSMKFGGQSYHPNAAFNRRNPSREFHTDGRSSFSHPCQIAVDHSLQSDNFPSGGDKSQFCFREQQSRYSFPSCRTQDRVLYGYPQQKFYGNIPNSISSSQPCFPSVGPQSGCVIESGGW